MHEASWVCKLDDLTLLIYRSQTQNPTEASSRIVEVVSTTEALANHDRIVICIPCFNEVRWLERTLQSVRNQTMADFAVLVSDNGSTDGTAEVADQFAAADPRFQVHRHAKNIGAAANFNFAREATDSPYLLWLGAHDVLHPRFLAHHLARMGADDRLSLSQSAHEWIDEQDRPVERVEDLPLDAGPPNSVARYLGSIRANRNNIGINSVIRRAMLEGIGFTPLIGTDRIILSRLAYRGPFAECPDVLYYRRTFRSDRGGWSGYMERLTGHSIEASEDGWKMLAAAYDRDLRSLIGEGARQRAARWLLQLILRYYLPVDRGSLTTILLWTVRRSIKRLRPPAKQQPS